MAELQDLINSIKEGNGEQKGKLHEIERDGRNSRRHLLEIKKEMFKLTEMISIIAVPPVEIDTGAEEEARREQKRFQEKELKVFESMAKGLENLTKNVREAEKKKGGSFLGNVGKGAIGFGLGAAASGIDIGLGAAGAGIGAFFIGLAGAEAIMERFGNGDNIKKLLTNLGEGLDSLSDRSMTALAVALGAGAALGAIPGLSGAGAGMGIAWVGAGIAGFFTSLALGDAAMSWLGTDMSGLKKATKGLNDALKEMDDKTLAVVGGLLATGGGAAALFGVKKVGKAAIGMGVIGLGIASFFTGLALADATMGWLDSDGSKLNAQIKNLTEGLGYLVADPAVLATVGGLLAGGAGAAALFGPSKMAKATVGMGAIGLGIGAFFAGLAAGDAAANWMSADGTTLKNIMKNLAEGLGAFSGGQLAGLSALLATGGIFGAIPGGTAVVGSAGIGMGLIGAGLAAFFVGFATIGEAASFLGADGAGMKDIMVNLADGLSAFNRLDGANLIAVSAGIAAIGPAMGVFFGSQGIGSIVGGALDLAKDGLDLIFGSDGEDATKKKTVFEKIVESLKPLESIDATKLGAFNAVTDALQRFSDLDLDKGEHIQGFAEGLRKALPDIETAVYGGEFSGFTGKDVVGLAGNEAAYLSAAGNLRQLQMAATAVDTSAIEMARAQAVANNNTNNFFAGSQNTISMPSSTVKKGKANLLNPADMLDGE